MKHLGSIASTQQCHVPLAAVPGPAPSLGATDGSCQNRGIWSDLPMETGIATLVCYAGVFGDVIGVEEMASRLGVSGQDEFYTALNKLHGQGRIILKDGFATLPSLEDKLRIKASKIETTGRLIGSRREELKTLGRSPFTKFVGISGSLAAQNPVSDRNNHLDLDIFLITRNQCLWLHAISRGIRNLFQREKGDPELCINYVMDESDLGVSNKNFYTATEIRNIIPVSGLDTFRRFLHVNHWVDYYYPGFSGSSAPVDAIPSGNLINKLLYILYTMLKSIKHLSLVPLRNISFKTDPIGGFYFNRISVRYGGYQALVHKKFTRLAIEWFPDLVDAELINKLFPDELSVIIRRGEIDVFELNVVQSQGADYSKYG